MVEPLLNIFQKLFNYIAGDIKATKRNLDEIMNTKIRNELENVRDALDLWGLQLAVWKTFLTTAGFTNINSFNKK